MLPVGLQAGDGVVDSVVQVVVGEMGLQMGPGLGLDSSSVVHAAVAVSEGSLGGAAALVTAQSDCGGEDGAECIGAAVPAAPTATAAEAGSMSCWARLFLCLACCNCDRSRRSERLTGSHGG